MKLIKLICDNIFLNFFYFYKHITMRDYAWFKLTLNSFIQIKR